MVSSDERREVARKIREYVDAYGDGIDDAEMVLLGTVWGRDNRGDVVRPTSEAELLSMLADLIDPTCEVDSIEPVEDELGQTVGYEFHLTCGHTCETFWREPPAHCDMCGARVIHDDN